MAHEFKKRFALLIAEFFYMGRMPFAPGTWGSLGSFFIWVPSVLYSWPLWLKLLILILIFFLGIWASRYGIDYYQKEDPKQVVIDEVVGQGIPFLIISFNFLDISLAFLAFRFFDILKPWPIKYLEKSFPNAFGIMIDDVVAGIFALLVLFLYKFYLG